MTSPALMWLDDDRLNVAGLKPDASNTIGRLAGSTVVVDDPTVSRQQARVSFDGARFLAENLSSTNPTRLNGTQLQAPTPLSDGDRLTAGVMDLTFHDLAVGDRLSGPMCSHCGRENSSTQRDCWYCGTSLVSAATTIRQRLQVAARIVTRDGAWYDLYPKAALVLPLEGAPRAVDVDEAALSAPAWVESSDAGVIVRLGASSDGVTVDGHPAGDRQSLRSGAEIRVGDRRFSCVVR